MSIILAWFQKTRDRKTMAETIAGLEQLVKLICRKVSMVGMITAVVMMGIITLDVIGRYFFNHPIPGTMDIVIPSLVVLTWFAMAYTGAEKGHVGVDIIVKRLPLTAQTVISVITNFLSIGLLSLITWESFLYAVQIWQANQTTPALRIPLYPFVFVVAFGATLYLMVVIVDFIIGLNTLREMNSPKAWVGLAVGGLLSILLCLALAGQWLPKIEPHTAGLVMLGLLFITLFSGLPVALGLALLGFLGMSYLNDLQAGLALLGIVPYTSTAHYDYSVIALFVLMGELCFALRISEDLYNAVYKWLGHLPGGIAAVTLAACGGFAAICGSSVAILGAIGSAALPEFRKFKYDASLYTGCLAAGGTIGVLIPPSTMFVIYGIVAEQSIGRLFIAGIIPGILLTIMFTIYALVRCKLNPNLGPPGARATMRERMGETYKVLPVVILFLLVIGGIYGGIFTPTEAAGIGAFGALIIGLILRRVKTQNFTHALIETGKITALSILLIATGQIIGYFYTITNLPTMASEFISGLPLPPMVIMAIIVFFYVILGCFIPAIPMIILTVPIFLPTVIILGFDAIWFGVIIVILCEMAYITPPVGVNLYVMKGMVPDVPIGVIFRGCAPFVVILAILIAILFAFPQIALYLPNMMKGAAL